MIDSGYFDSIGEGIEYLLALGAIIGLLGLIMGIILFIFGSSRYRTKMMGVIIISIILLSICGGYGRSLKYFRLH